MIKCNQIAGTAAGLMQTWEKGGDFQKIYDAHISSIDTPIWDIAAKVALVFEEEVVKRGTWIQFYPECVEFVATTIQQGIPKSTDDCYEVRHVIHNILNIFGKFK